MSIIEEFPVRSVRMANLAIVLSHSVNGVAALHSELLTTTVFPFFHQFFPGKFQNKTNGVTPRRWLHQANPNLSALITSTLGNPDWLLHLDQLANLRPYADDPAFQQKWFEIKFQNKVPSLSSDSSLK
jgi:glycogen phosphorylase